MLKSKNRDLRATHEHGTECGCLARRGMLTAFGAFGALGLIGCSAPATPSATATPAAIMPLTKAQRDALSPDDVTNLMKRGNERFRSGELKDRDWQAQQRISPEGQWPMAVLLSCIDSRAPAEILFDLGLGDIFNTRLAGNVVDPAVLGGMEFACKLAGSKVVMVLGHTRCGAVAGAIAGARLGNLTGLLAKIQPAIAPTRFTGDRSASNYAFVDAVARTHVGLTMASIRKNSSILAGLEKDGEIKIVGGMYDLSTGAVEFMS